MVVCQIALSLMLLSAGGLFARGALKAASANPGFSYDRQLLVGVDPTLVQYDEVRGRASYARGADAHSRAARRGRGRRWRPRFRSAISTRGIRVERVGGPARPDLTPRLNANYRVIGTNYFRTLNLPMVRGREFTEAEELSPKAPRVAIVDERLARKLFGADDPLGQMIRYTERPGEHTKNDGEPMEIVGIAAPIRDELFDREVGARDLRTVGTQLPRQHVRARPRAAQAGTEGDLLDAIRREIRAYDPRLPVVQATTMTAFHDRSLELWAVRSGGRLFLMFGVLALLLAVVGLYGVKSYLVSQRTREIGIRMALGARPGDVLGMVLREGAMLSAAGVALGLPLAALLGVRLSSLLYDVKPLDPVVFLTAPAVLALAALVATLSPRAPRHARDAADGAARGLRGVHASRFTVCGCRVLPCRDTGSDLPRPYLRKSAVSASDLEVREWFASRFRRSRPWLLSSEVALDRFVRWRRGRPRSRRGHASVGNTVRCCGLGRRRHAQRRMRGERDREVAAAVRVGRPGACQREDRARREALEVPRVERRVGGDDDHAGAVGVRRDSACIGAAALGVSSFHTGTPSIDEPAAVVALHEDADRPGVVRRAARPSRRGADAALPAERDRAGAGADRAFLDRARPSRRRSPPSHARG